MSARDDILGAIRKHCASDAARPAPYAPTMPIADPVQHFATMAQNAAAEIRLLDSAEQIADAVADILRARNMAAEIHLPANSALQIDWTKAAGLTRLETPPGPDDAALTRAPLAIAETGTLAYPAADDAPASWHFRPGLEIAILHADDILAHMEDALARVKALGLPPTLNFVTGPSRTGDIEQTLELGAHGPKALAILVVKG